MVDTVPELIDAPEWRDGVRQALSNAFAPVTVRYPQWHYALPQPLLQKLRSFLDWMCSCLTNDLARELLHQAWSCQRYILLHCCAPEEPCCFTQRTSKPRVQVCFCNTDAQGQIQRTLFYVLDARLVLLLHVCYVLGHAQALAHNLAVQWYASPRDEQQLRGEVAALRNRLNACAAVVQECYHNPPAPFLRRRPSG